MLLEMCVTELEDVAEDTETVRNMALPVVQESLHPYTDDMCITGTVRIPGTEEHHVYVAAAAAAFFIIATITVIITIFIILLSFLFFFWLSAFPGRFVHSVSPFVTLSSYLVQLVVTTTLLHHPVH